MSTRSQAATARTLEPTPPRPGSIISPVVDFLCVGGLSLIVFLPLLASGRTDLVIIGVGAQAFLAAVINMPHFMASYRLVYRSRESILRHRWASIYVPLFLLAYIGVALWEAQHTPAGGSTPGANALLVKVLVFVGSVYLAWHYTGQAWGMMASHAYLAGTAFDQVERRLIRSSLYVLLAWHVLWFLYNSLRNPGLVRIPYLLVSEGTVVAFAVGAWGLTRMWRRTGRRPPTLSLVAWLAIFVWYAVIWRDPKALFWIQIAHALQYLVFPIRVEMNQSLVAPTSRPLAVRMALYGGVLLAVSWIVAEVVPYRAMDVVGGIFGEEPGRAAPILILMFINIHHYFTDGVIWKISNPEVRKELFAHVPRPPRAR